MAKNRKGGRVAGCIVSLVGFVLLIVAFVMLIFFLFSGLSYFLDGEQIELPEWGTLWGFMTDNVDEFFNDVDNTLNEIPVLMDEIGGEVDDGTQMPTESTESTDEGQLTVWMDEAGSMMVSF